VTSRRQARRQALFLVYQWDISGTPLGSQFAGEIDPWALSLAEETIAAVSDLDERITQASQGWDADRLGAIERSALRVAICELDRGVEPVEVVIDEAVGCTKRYASEEGARLVNGILGAIQRAAAVGG
jgi:N utilization substance protein B